MKPITLITFLPVACIALVIMFQSCRKDPAAVMTHDSAEALLKSWTPAPQNFTIDAEQGGQIDAGIVHLYIKPGSLRQGSRLVKGPVTVSLTVIESKKDMISSGISTVGIGGILESGGMFKIEMWQNGAELSVDSTMPMRARLEDPKGTLKEGMSLFSMALIPVKDTNGNIIGWIQTQWVPQSGNVETDTASESYVFDWWKMGWCNIDRYIDQDNCTSDFRAVLSPGMNAANTSVMFVFTDYHAEAPAVYEDLTGSFTTSYCLPLNKAVKLVCVTIKEKQLYYSITDAIVNEGATVNIPEGVMVTDAELKALLESL